MGRGKRLSLNAYSTAVVSLDLLSYLSNCALSNKPKSPFGSTFSITTRTIFLSFRSRTAAKFSTVQNSGESIRLTYITPVKRVIFVSVKDNASFRLHRSRTFVLLQNWLLRHLQKKPAYYLVQGESEPTTNTIPSGTCHYFQSNITFQHFLSILSISMEIWNHLCKYVHRCEKVTNLIKESAIVFCDLTSNLFFQQNFPQHYLLKNCWINISCGRRIWLNLNTYSATLLNDITRAREGECN